MTKITADTEVPVAEGYEFVGWDKDFENVTNYIIVKATYKKVAIPANPFSTGLIKTEVSGGTGFTIVVDGGVACPQVATYLNSKAPGGADVTITANSTSNAPFVFSA